MRYHLTKPEYFTCRYGQKYICDHPVYDSCTLYKINDKGLAVIQQRFNDETKTTWWTNIDEWLVDLLYLNENFEDYFNKYSGLRDGCGFYPTVTLRQIMWGLKMKPLKRERWETTFDHRNI